MREGAATEESVAAMVWGCEDGGGVDREEPEEGDGCHLVGRSGACCVCG